MVIALAKKTLSYANYSDFRCKKVKTFSQVLNQYAEEKAQNVGHVELRGKTFVLKEELSYKKTLLFQTIHLRLFTLLRIFSCKLIVRQNIVSCVISDNTCYGDFSSYAYRVIKILPSLQSHMVRKSH